MRAPTILVAAQHDPAQAWPVGPTPPASIDLLRRAVDTVEALLCQPVASCAHLTDCATERAFSFVVPAGVRRARIDALRSWDAADGTPPAVEATTTASGAGAADVITWAANPQVGAKTMLFAGEYATDTLMSGTKDDAAPVVACDRLVELPEGLVWTVEDGTIEGCCGWGLWCAVQSPDREAL